MSFGRPGGFGGGPAAPAPTPAATPPQAHQPARQTSAPATATASAPPARGSNDSPFGRFEGGEGGFGDYGPPPPRAPGSGDRKKAGDKMEAGVHTAWVEEIVSWPGTGLTVTWTNTSYQKARWDQQPGEALLRPEKRTALQLWTQDIVNCYEAAGFPERDWERRRDAAGNEYRVPPTHAFWWVYANGVAVPIAFEINIELNYKGYHHFKSIRPLAGPRLAPMPTTLTRQIRDYLKYPHRDEAIVPQSGRNAGESIPVAKIDRRDAWLTGTGLQSIEDMLPRKRGGG